MSATPAPKGVMKNRAPEQCFIIHPGSIASKSIPKGTSSPRGGSSLISVALSEGKTGMTGPKKPLTRFEMALFGWFVASLVLWVILVPAPVESLVIEDPVWIDGQSESEALQGASPPCWPCTADNEASNTPLLRLVRLRLAPATASSLTGAIFRLKRIRLHPPVGPPPRFFAGPVTG